MSHTDWLRLVCQSPRSRVAHWLWIYLGVADVCVLVLNYMHRHGPVIEAAIEAYLASKPRFRSTHARLGLTYTLVPSVWPSRRTLRVHGRVSNNPYLNTPWEMDVSLWDWLDLVLNDDHEGRYEPSHWGWYARSSVLLDRRDSAFLRYSVVKMYGMPASGVDTHSGGPHCVVL